MMKKMEERRENNEVQLNEDIMDAALPPDSIRNQFSDIGNQLVPGGGMSHDNHSILRSSKDNTTHINPSSIRHSGSAKMKIDDVEKLEKKCQRMIYEKEEKYLENEQKLKDEY